MILANDHRSLDEYTTEVQKVLVARSYLSEGTVLTGKEFDLVEYPVTLLPEEAIIVMGTDIKNKKLLYPLVAGEILLQKDLTGGEYEPKVFLTMETDSFTVKKGDKVAVMATKEDKALTLLDNLPVQDVKENQYDNTKMIIVGAKEEEAQALHLLKAKANLSVIPSTGGLRVASDPLLAARDMIQEESESGSKRRQVEVIEGGVVSWYEIE